jgi:hypothetical protein
MIGLLFHSAPVKFFHCPHLGVGLLLLASKISDLFLKSHHLGLLIIPLGTVWKIHVAEQLRHGE